MRGRRKKRTRPLGPSAPGTAKKGAEEREREKNPKGDSNEFVAIPQSKRMTPSESSSYLGFFFCVLPPADPPALLLDLLLF
jgi:hypothetical protein